MRHSKEEKQQEKISKLQRQLEDSKKRIKSLENKLSTSERKRRILKTDSDKKKANTESCLYSLLNDINTLNL